MVIHSIDFKNHKEGETPEVEVIVDEKRSKEKSSNNMFSPSIKGGLPIRLIAFVCVFIGIIFILVCLILAILSAFMSMITLFQLPEFKAAFSKYWRLYRGAIIATISAIIVVFSPRLGFKFFTVYALTKMGFPIGNFRRFF